MDINKSDGAKENRIKDQKSIVWNYFKKEDNVSARCKLCTKILKHSGNTTNLMQHLKRMHELYLQSDQIPQRQKISAIKSKNIKERIHEKEQEEEIDNPSNSINDVPSYTMQHKVNYNFKINIVIKQNCLHILEHR